MKPSSKAQAKPVSKAGNKPTSRAGSQKPASRANSRKPPSKVCILRCVRLLHTHATFRLRMAMPLKPRSLRRPLRRKTRTDFISGQVTCQMIHSYFATFSGYCNDAVTCRPRFLSLLVLSCFAQNVVGL